MKRKKKCTFKRLELVEVQQIFQMKGEGKSIREISRSTRRSTSTVHRILNDYRPPSSHVWLAMNVWERARHVYLALKSESRKGGNHGRLRDATKREYVLKKLTEEHWSPEEIAGRMPQELPGSTISAKTIYNFIKHERTELTEFLMQRGKPKRQRVLHRRGRFKQGAPAKRSVHDRPAVVEERQELGHFEGDLICSGRDGSGALLSITERVTRKKFLRRLPDTTAKTVLAYLWGFIEGLPTHMRKSLTLDNGSEFAFSQLIKLEQSYPGLHIYYCDPYCSWQKGTVENANRDVRWYIPKGTDISGKSKKEIAEVEARLGQRPLKCLGYKTPDECFELALQQAA
jgi:IS30 family transposase